MCCDVSIKNSIYHSRLFFFTVLPVLMAIGVSFTDWNMLEKPEFVGWQNYVKLLLDDEIFIISLKNTLIFAVITGPVSYMLCLLFAWIINEFNRGMRTLLTLIFYAPSICGNAYMVWNLILTGDRYGYLNGILLNLDIINEPILWMKTEQYVMPMLIIVQLWLSLGTGFLSFIAGLQTVDKSMYEAAAIDGATKWQQVLHVTIPHLRTMIAILFIMNVGKIFASDFGLFYNVPMQNGALFSVTQTIDTYVYRAYMATGDPGQSSAAGLLQNVLGFVCILTANGIVKKIDSESSLF